MVMKMDEKNKKFLMIRRKLNSYINTMEFNDFDYVDSEGYNLLMLAFYVSDRKEILNSDEFLFLINNSNCNQLDKDGWNALNFASNFKTKMNGDCWDLLIEKTDLLSFDFYNEKTVLFCFRYLEENNLKDLINEKSYSKLITNLISLDIKEIELFFDDRIKNLSLSTTEIEKFKKVKESTLNSYLSEYQKFFKNTQTDKKLKI